MGQKSKKTNPIRPTPEPTPAAAAVSASSTSATSSSFSDAAVQTTAKSPDSAHHSDGESAPSSPEPTQTLISKTDNKRPADTNATPNPTTKRVKKDSTPKKPTEPENQTNLGSGLGSGSVLGLDATTVTTGKPLFQRLWSDEDELVILKGMIDYKANKGLDPMSNVDDFLVYIKKSLHVVDANKGQIVSKVRRLKSRFLNSHKKKVTDPHEIKVLEYSKMIWPSPLSRHKPKKAVRGEVNVENGGVENVEVGLGFDEEGVAVLREAMSRVQGEERKEIKTMLEKANVAYLDAYVLRLKVLELAANKLLDEINNS